MIAAWWHRVVLGHLQTKTYYRVFGRRYLVCSCERVWGRS